MKKKKLKWGYEFDFLQMDQSDLRGKDTFQVQFQCSVIIGVL